MTSTSAFALDAARVLTRPIADLEATDIAPAALEALRGSSVREVVVLGRRGPSQASFRPPEIKELLGFDHVIVPAHLGAIYRTNARIRRFLERFWHFCFPPPKESKIFDTNIDKYLTDPAK